MAVTKFLKKSTMQIAYEFGLNALGETKVKTQSIRNLSKGATANQIIGLSDRLEKLFEENVVGTKLIEEHELNDVEEA